MARPLRIEFPGALYHVTSRGNRRENIYENDTDRTNFLLTLAEVCNQYNWSIYAYCLMSNHYHLLVETPDGNLSKGMRQLNGVYTLRYNKSNRKVGHVFQGRFKGILIDADSYLKELCRYIVLNPVRAQMVRSANQWGWSSYRATVGTVESPSWLDTEWLLSGFARRKKTAIVRYKVFVSEGKNQPSPWENLRNQVFLGDEQFVEQMLSHVEKDKKLSEVPRVQRKVQSKPIANYSRDAASRNEAIVNAYASGAYTLQEVGDYFGLHYTTVSGIIKNHKCHAS